MFDTERIEQLARELNQSKNTRTPLQQFTQRFPDMTIQDGYKISRAWVAMQLAQGKSIIGHKIGLTSRAMQIAMQISEPDYGTLLDDMQYTCTPGQTLDIPLDRFITPRVEVELAFVLKSPLQGPDVSIEQVLAATDYVTPAVEIIDFRIAPVDPLTGSISKVFDTISDNAANAGIIIGAEKIAPDKLDLPWCGAILSQNGIIEETGLAAGVQGHPAIGVAWLANKLAPWNETMLPGQIILAGSFTRPVVAKAGDTFKADYGPLGTLSFRFF
ncbi:2-oxo-hepta-3-ene-1,7-dioic acid hydratase [Advenella faeciporci]|uniref:2-oxo-hepta-3-ene-1,7-dioic acid hydratase n=1 Tax=Advenella faeciporci TaxID=797535 RepID=A0A918JKT2_9BURK|nr:2-oxo-hepta-3-ene-1,7-dioic acid hydratase [Advenella faeciporci]GGW86958.1 2-oxo-hepta-3-ene-1,7-dioic acid hydratase [Advenella faeciporci]